jgi:hypothetical protein
MDQLQDEEPGGRQRSRAFCCPAILTVAAPLAIIAHLHLLLLASGELPVRGTRGLSGQLDH